MADTTKMVPEADKVESGVENARSVAKGLAEVLADTYRLVFKSHAYHWNVEGPLFHAIHVLTEAQYTEMFAAADVLAERIRALGQLAPSRMANIVRMSNVADLDTLPGARDMVLDLAEDHTRLAHRLRELIGVAEEENDPVTADLLTGRAAVHEKAAWVLRATSK